MPHLRPQPTGHERTFHEHEIIVSKTDVHGVITYANDVFLRVSGYHEEELLGQPHSMIRHPEMPRAVFKLLWDTVAAGQEIFAYVVNLAANGDHYWVLAHVTPTFDPRGRITGFHSSRRVPDRGAVQQVTGLYAQLCAEERRHRDKKAGLEASSSMLGQVLSSKGIGYDEFLFSLIPVEAR